MPYYRKTAIRLPVTSDKHKLLPQKAEGTIEDRGGRGKQRPYEWGIRLRQGYGGRENYGRQRG